MIFDTNSDSGYDSMTTLTIAMLVTAMMMNITTAMPMMMATMEVWVTRGTKMSIKMGVRAT